MKDLPVCKQHRKNPAIIYHQCIGCEIEWYQKELRKLQEALEAAKAPEATEATE